MLYGAMVAYTALLLWADARFDSLAAQHGLGAVTLAVLLFAMRFNTREERRQVWLCVAFSTCIELLFTQSWGLYSYRFGNVPLYVPPGHGLIFAVAARAARSTWMQRHDRGLVAATLGVATAAALAGLFVLPAWTGRVDVHGALYWPFFAWGLVRSPHARAFTATFWWVAVIELYGVYLGTWHWAPIMPNLGLPAADPPSVVAGGYCFFGLIATYLARLTGVRGDSLRARSRGQRA